MSKALKIAAVVVGIAAVIVTGGAALGLLPAVLPILGGISAVALGTILSVTATILSLAAGVLAKPPKLQSTGQQLEWAADPAAGEPYVMGDAMVGASIVHQASWGDKNKFLGIVGVLSVCTIAGYDGLYADMTQVTFSGRNAVGYYSGFMYQSTQLGAMPETSALNMTAPDASNMPNWDSTHKTSGLATVGLVLVADTANGKVYSGGTPQLTNRIRGVLAYDPRLDSTQSGGSGVQRALNESTYAYSENPFVHALTYAMGRWQNGVKVIGPGLAPAQIDVPAFVEAANIADYNGWKISGQVYSTDDKWTVLKSMCQAGGGYPMPSGALLSCLVNAPRVSLATINQSDVKGAVSAPQMLTRRSRYNGAIPRARLADQGWQIAALTAIRNSTYLTQDGGSPSTQEIEFPLVADKGDGHGKNQAAQLAAYEVANSRERNPISVDLGYAWSQYKLGDCLTLNLPDANLVNQKCVVIGRSVNPAKNTVTLVFRTEDDAKHSWALGTGGSTSIPPAISQPHGTGDMNTVQPGADVTGTHAAVGDGNRVRFSLFEGGLEGWAGYTGGLTNTLTYGPYSGVVYIHASTVFTAPNQLVETIGTNTTTGPYAFPVTAGERLFVGGIISLGAGTPAAATWVYDIGWLDASGAEVGTRLNVVTGTGPLATATRYGAFATPPAGAVSGFLRLGVNNNAAGSCTIDSFVGQPIVCSAGTSQSTWPAFSPGPSGEPGAQVTRWVDGPSQRTSFRYDYTGVAQSGEFNRDFTFQLLTASGALPAAAWTYTVLTGNVNGFTNASGAQAMSGTTLGDFTVSSLGSSTATVQISASYGGQTYSKQITLTQDIAGAPISSGGSGTGAIATKNDGFSGISTTSFVDITGAIAGTMPTGKTAATVSVDLDVAPGTPRTLSGTWTIEVKLMRDVGGVPTQVGSTQSQTADWNNADLSGDDASFLFSISDTGLTAGTAYNWRLYAREVSGTKNFSVIGSVSITA